MLKSISVSGLRSLSDFHLELHPGLNVLVGPNGSGKSNILLAIEFLYQLHDLKRMSELKFLANVEVAKLFDVRERNKKIDIRIEGLIESFLIDQINSSNDGKDTVDLHYKYMCEIEFQPDQQHELFFSNQLLELATTSSRIGKRKNVLNLKYIDDKFIINKLDQKYLQKNFPTENFQSYFNFRSEALKYSSILYEFAREFIPFAAILDEFFCRAPFNIKPEFIRYDLDDPSRNRIDSSGSGLLPTLLDISMKRKSLVKNDGVIEGLNYEDIYEKIIGYLQVTCPEVVDLEVSYNSQKDTINAYAIFEGANGTQNKIPIELLSDGTLKWLSLTTALLTSNKMFLLEEPENFIHPAMQKEFVELMRATIKHRKIIGIFTTHSESILNSLNPSEVIVTNFQNGRTIANRVENAEKIKEKLQSTGFGLGWYYLTGSMDPNPSE